MKKVLKYVSVSLISIILIATIYIYSLTFTPNGRMLWQQAAYAKLFHKVLNIQTSEIDGMIAQDLKNVDTKSILPVVGSFQTIKITADSLPLYIYKPINVKPNSPVVIYYHGGGFYFPMMSDAHKAARKYANAFNAIVVAVDYRVAPNYNFPVPINDCYNTFKWVAENATSIGGDANNLAVIGESAGGNISAVIAQKAMKDGYKNIKHQTLFCPSTDVAHMYAYTSCKRLQEGYVLDKKLLDFFFNSYLPTKTQISDTDVSPFLSDYLVGLPPALVITCEFDPIRDEGIVYYKKLKKSGVDAKFKELKGVLHVAQGPFMDEVNDNLIQEIAEELKKYLK